VIAPLRAGPCVEQHRGDDKIEGGACLSVSTRPICADDDLIPQVATSKHEMPPSRVHRHIESGITLADNPRDKARSRDQPVEIDRPIVQAPIKRTASMRCALIRTASARRKFSCAFRQRRIPIEGSVVFDVTSDYHRRVFRPGPPIPTPA